MAQLDRRKHDFDLLEHVLGGVHATSEADVGGLITWETHRPDRLEEADYEVAVEIERRRRPR